MQPNDTIIIRRFHLSQSHTIGLKDEKKKKRTSASPSAQRAEHYLYCIHHHATMFAWFTYKVNIVQETFGITFCVA